LIRISRRRDRKSGGFSQSRQQKDETGGGRQEKAAAHAWGGETAIVTYALLAAAKIRRSLTSEAVECSKGKISAARTPWDCGRRCGILLPTAARHKAVIDGTRARQGFRALERGLKGAEKAFTGILMGRRGAMSLWAR